MWRGWQIVVCSALTGAGQAVLTGSATAYASLFARPRYLQAVCGGQGVAGLSVAIGSLAVSLPGIAEACSTKVGGGGGGSSSSSLSLGSLGISSSSSSLGSGHGFGADDDEHARDVISAAVTYFGGAVAVLTLYVFAFAIVEILPFTRARKRLMENARRIAPSVPATPLPPSLGDSLLTATSSATAAATSAATNNSMEAASLANGGGRVPLIDHHHHSSGAGADGGSGGAGTSRTSKGYGGGRDGHGGEQSTLDLARELWKWCTAVFLIFVVTIALFPSYTSTIVAAPATNHSGGGLSSSGGGGGGTYCEWQRLFVPLSFVIFNLCDTIGRNLPWLLEGPNTILGLVLARFAFVPLFMLCHTGSPPAPRFRSPTPHPPAQPQRLAIAALACVHAANHVCSRLTHRFERRCVLAATANGGAIQLPIFALTDALPIVIMVAFAMSNGWLTTSIFVASQGTVDAARRDPAASLLVCLLNSGDGRRRLDPARTPGYCGCELLPACHHPGVDTGLSPVAVHRHLHRCGALVPRALRRVHALRRQLLRLQSLHQRAIQFERRCGRRG